MEKATKRNNGAESDDASSSCSWRGKSKSKAESERKGESQGPYGARGQRRHSERRRSKRRSWSPKARTARAEEASSGRQDSLRGMGRRPSGRGGEVTPGPMVGRAAHCSPQRHLLGRGSAGSWVHPRPPDQGRVDDGPVGFERLPERGFGEVERKPSYASSGFACVRPRLCQDEPRRSSPYGEGPIGAGSQERRLDGQPGRGEGARGRASSVESEGQLGRRNRARESGTISLLRRQGRQEKEEEREEKREEEKEQAKGDSNERAQRSLRFNRLGPRPFSAEAHQEEGSKVGQEKEVNQGFREQFELRVNRGKQGGSRSPRRSFRGRGPGQDHLEELPRGAHVGDSRADEGVVDDADGPDVGCRRRGDPPAVHHVLAPGAVNEDERTPVQGDANLGPGPRPAAAGQDLSSLRCADPENEILGTDFQRMPFCRSAETRTGSSGHSEHVFSGGNLGGVKGPSRRAESVLLDSKAMGESPRRREERRSKRQRKAEKWKRKEQESVGWQQRRKRKKGGRKREEGMRESQGSDNEKGWKETKRLQEEETKGVGPLLRTETAPAEGCETFHLKGVGLKEPSPRFFEGFSTEGRSLGEVADHLLSMFKKVQQNFQPLHGTTKCSGSIFPLPDTQAVLEQLVQPRNPIQAKVLQMLCIGLNSYYGASSKVRNPLPRASVAAVRALDHYAQDICAWEEKFTGVRWEDYLGVKTVDYHGEEVKVAMNFCWSNIKPALPEGIGSIPLEEVCELGTKEFVLNFEEYLVPEDSRVYTKPPRVFVNDSDWEEVCRGLLDKGVCALLPEREVCRVGTKLLLNGMFGVSKSEFQNNYEVMRVIMNLVPTNKLCRSLGGDISTLPSWAGMSPYILEDGQVVLLSSEDIRCFFYLFSIPRSWWGYMCFSKEVPSSLWPSGKSGPFFLCSKVLPMGYLNSVSIAQHVHRRIARLALRSMGPTRGGHTEIRKDQSFSSSDWLFRVYLDNFDILQKVDAKLASTLEGEPSPEILALRDTYEQFGLPRHPKKSVQQSTKAEIQGAIVDGVMGLVKPKPDKVLKYVELALRLLQKGDSTQRQMQIVCGGFVYCCMFRRALLGTLNSVWQFIVSFKGDPPFIRRKIPLAASSEIIRFIMLVPLAQMNLRAPLKGAVTASDASEYGGGFCVSKGLTPMGCHASSCHVRGDLPEIEDHVQVLTVGLFDGIGALRVSADALLLPMGGHVSSEVNPEGRRVLESQFPDTESVGNVEDIDEDMVRTWALRYSNVGVVVVGGGPPCQGVSGLNSDRKGSLRDARSKLFVHVPRIYKLCKRFFKWAQVHHLMESVASMDDHDRAIMSESIGCCPWRIEAAGVSLCRRPRLYWISWELQASEGVTLKPGSDLDWYSFGEVHLQASFDPADFLTSGWKLNGDVLPTFTTSRPRPSPGNRPAGLWQCLPEEVARWKEDLHRYPPYVYRWQHGLSNSQGEWRLPSISEKEVIMGFPLGFTAPCLPKAQQKGEAYLDTRHTLIGNSWHVPTISWLLLQLFQPLGLTPLNSLSDVVTACTPGASSQLATYLRRPPLRQQRKVTVGAQEHQLTSRLSGFISVKGEDLLLQAATENSVKFHRLRTSVPARLWRWRVACGWAWRHQGYHINTLELQAVLGTLQWRLERLREGRCRFVHLTDSLVSLHSLTRGRSSSRKLRGTLSKINALLLAADVRPIWAYVNTKQNPADRPSRRPVLKTCRKRKSL